MSDTPRANLSRRELLETVSKTAEPLGTQPTFGAPAEGGGDAPTETSPGGSTSGRAAH